MEKTKGKAVLQKRQSITIDVAKEELVEPSTDEEEEQKEPKTEIPVASTSPEETKAITDSTSTNDAIPDADTVEEALQCPEGYHPNEAGTECLMDEPAEPDEQHSQGGERDVMAVDFGLKTPRARPNYEDRGKSCPSTSRPIDCHVKLFSSICVIMLTDDARSPSG